MQESTRKIQGLALSLAALSFASIVPEAQTTLPSSYAVPSSAVDTTKKGFLVRTWKSPGEPNTIAWAEDQLAGLHGPNTAITSVFTDNVYGNSYFDETGVIDYWNSGGEGNFSNNGTQTTPGLANDGSNDDSYSIEAFAILDLPVGTLTMAVNSDDGFRVNALQSPDPREQFGVTRLGQFEGGRGVADTTFQIVVQQAGLYPVRLVYEEGGGDAAVEWFTVGADTTKHLINDPNDPASIKAYRMGTSPRAVVSKALPRPGSTGVGPNAAVEIEIVDGSSPIDVSTVKVSLDGTPFAAVPTKSGSVTTAKYSPSALYGSGTSHNVSLVYTDGGNSITQNWSFRVAVYASIPATAKVTPDTSKPGFVMNIFANSANTVNSNARSESSLNGLLLDGTTGAPLPNLADPNAKGAALAASTAANPANAPIKFEIAGVINLNQDAVGQTNGNFQPDLQFPGIPPTDGISDGYAAEFLSYVELPAGLVTMGVNSDDGFRTTLGFDAVGSSFLGEFEGGRGAGDTIFNFFVQQAGVYPMRTIYEEGGGDSNIEIFSLKADGMTKVLINDTANGGLKAYRALVGPVNPYVKYVSPGREPRQLNQPFSQVVIVLADGTNPVDANSIVLKIDGQAVTTANVREGTLLKVTYTPTTLQIPTDVHNAELTFKDSTGGFTSTQQWQFRNLKNLVLPAPKITENFDSYPEDTQPTGWAAWNFSSQCTVGRDITDQTSESYENWVVVSTANMILLDGGSANIAPGQTFNGQPVDGMAVSLASGNVLYAESDGRCNTDALGRGYSGQAQFIVSKAFDCSQITNVVLTLSALYTQNQDSVGAIEYSVDGGATWLPVVYYLDFVDGGGDIKLNPDGTVDAVSTFTSPNADTANWVTNGVPKGDNYGDALGAPITQALGDFVAPRYNDDQFEGARIEVFRLAQAGRKSDVRLRFAQLGTDSWWFAVDNIAFYDVAAPVASIAPAFNPPTLSGTSVTLSWTGTGTLEEITAVGGTWSTSPSQNNPQTVTATGNKFYRLRQ